MDEKVILLIEDEPTISRILSMYYKKAGFKVMSALDGKKGLELFGRYDFDLVCLDIMIPTINGWEVAKRIRQVSSVPIILMSALSEEEDILKGYSLDIDDYVTKPFSPSVLVAKIQSLFNRIEIEHSIETVLNIHGINFEFTSLESSSSLEELLTSDELTGVSNRRYIDFYIDTKIKKAQDFHVGFGLLFVDIDHFKNINDTYGHSTGDTVLREMAQLIKNNLRNEDMIGRFGGEEFLVVLQVDNLVTLKKIAEKIRRLIADFVFDKEQHKLEITASIGGTLYREEDNRLSLIERADKCMYYSKEHGRNQTTIE